jgi:hypothetical protein
MTVLLSVTMVCIIAGTIKLCDDHDLSSRQAARRKASLGTLALAAVFGMPFLVLAFHVLTE